MSASIRSLRNGNALTEIIGASRDDLLLGDEITVSSVDAATTYTWTLAFTPEDEDGSASIAVFLSPEGSDGPSARFNIDNEGAYLIRLIIDQGMITEDTQFVRLRALTEFGRLRLVSAGERRDSVAVIPVDADPEGWANDQNQNIQILRKFVAKASLSGRVYFVDANRGQDSSNDQNDVEIAKDYGDFSSINAATAAALAHPDQIPTSDHPFVIAVRPGHYIEDLSVQPWVFVVSYDFIPRAKDSTAVHRVVQVRTSGTSITETHCIDTANVGDFSAVVGLTLENVNDAVIDQAAVDVNGPGRVLISNCSILQTADAATIGPALQVNSGITVIENSQVISFVTVNTSSIAMVVDGADTEVHARNLEVLGQNGVDVNPSAALTCEFTMKGGTVTATSADAGAFSVRSVASLCHVSNVIMTSAGTHTIRVNPEKEIKAGTCRLRVSYSDVGDIFYDTENLTTTSLQLESSRVVATDVLPDIPSLTLGYVEALTVGESLQYDNLKIAANPITAKNVQDAIDEIASGGIGGGSAFPDIYENGWVKVVIEAADSPIVPVDIQYIVFGAITIDGTFTVDGDLVIL